MAYSSPKQYEVFISFRGEDTRSNFVSHLRSALGGRKIKTYADDEDLEKGDEVWPSLSRAIDNSYVAIVVFSQNYATSKWCLKELVKILECRRSKGLVVIPVFYEVDPSHIRKHNGTYGEAIAQHEKYFGGEDKEMKESIKEWKDALTEAANISGWDSRSRDYKTEAQMIQKIVEDVLEKLNLRFPIELKVRGLVQIDQICEEVKLLLSKNKKNQLLENVQVIGIWGMGGIGKTTIAKALFSQLFPQYDSVCFLANLGEESKRLGPICVRDKLLSNLLKDECQRSDGAGSMCIMRRLSNKKILIVLDDVNSLDQLDFLYGECSYADPDSKIIVTTRDRHLLISASVDEIYDVKTLCYPESLELFSLHAFKQRRPQKGYEGLSRRAVEYAGGVPLALKVLGSNLYSRDRQFWDSELSKLMKFPNDAIQSVLQVSYDGLDSLQKQILLDIAFFFKGGDKDDVIRILDACGFYATSGVQVLVDKALVNISVTNRIQMHDLIQEMSLNVVRHGIQDPGSRLIYVEEVSDVLENKKGSDAVQGIKLDLSEIDDLHLNADSFDMMNNLRILIFHIPLNKESGKVYYPKALNKLSGKLRYLEWKGCRLKSLPATFSAKMLVEIHMPHSHVTELWPGVKDVVNLVLIDLSECKQLKNVPDLSKASKLEWVNLSGCESLMVVHPSVLSLDALKTLMLDGCKKLKSLKGVKHLTSLEIISVNGCISLGEFSVSSDSIKSLDLSSTGIEILDSSIGDLKNLNFLSVQGLRYGDLPSELSFLQRLIELKICNCSLAIDKQKLSMVFDGVSSLRVLHLKDCYNLPVLPDSIGGLSNLFELRLDGSSVRTLPANIWSLFKLETLSLVNCRNLEHLPELPPSVKILEAMNCSSLVIVSTLNFSFRGRKTNLFISFENCTGLDEQSINSIVKDAYIGITNLVFPSMSSDRDWLLLTFRDYLNNPGNVCFPGSRVPEPFIFQTTCASLTVDLPYSKRDFGGLILCAVVPPSTGAKIWCQCYMPDGTRLGHATTWHHKAENVTGLNSDHVYMWFDPKHIESILKIFKTDERELVFEFFVTSDRGESDVLTIPIQACGVSVLVKSKEMCNRMRSGSQSSDATGQSSDATCQSSYLYRSNDMNGQERHLTPPTRNVKGCFGWLSFW